MKQFTGRTRYHLCVWVVLLFLGQKFLWAAEESEGVFSLEIKRQHPTRHSLTQTAQFTLTRDTYKKLMFVHSAALNPRHGVDFFVTFEDCDNFTIRVYPHSLDGDYAVGYFSYGIQNYIQSALKTNRYTSGITYFSQCSASTPNESSETARSWSIRYLTKRDDFENFFYKVKNPISPHNMDDLLSKIRNQCLKFADFP